MFEVHGWAALRSDTYKNDDEADRRLLEGLEERIRTVEVSNMWLQLVKWQNGQLHTLLITGLKNHTYESAIGLFRWVAEHGPGSYGLLYVSDEDDRRFDEYVFRVWRLARGRLEEFDDPFLSPRIPVTEDPFDPERED